MLDEPEVVTSTSSGGPSAAELRRAAQNEQADLLRQAQDSEASYQQALAQQRREGRLGVLLLAACVVVGLQVLAAAVVGGWDQALKDSLTKHQPVSIETAVFQGIGVVLTLAIFGGVAGFVTWWACHYLSPGVRAGNATSLDFQVLITGVITYGVVAFFCAVILSGFAPEVAWQLAHHQPLGKNDGNLLEGWILLVSLGLFAGVAGLLWLVDSADLRQFGAGAGVDVERLAADWREVLRQVLLGFVREQISERTEARYATLLSISDAPGLREFRVGRRHVPTGADEQLLTISAGMDNGSIALSGPRGVGKSQLLHAFCFPNDPAGASPRLSIMMSAPVLYDRQEFMLLLFAKLCHEVVRQRLATAQAAEKHLRWIRYQQTRSAEATVSAGWRSWGVAARRGTELAQQPRTYPETVDRLKGFLGETAQVLGSGQRLVIGIDELDRIEPTAAASTFLNELKAVFDVPGCLFVLSVSDEALREAELAPVGRRDAFDSAIDEVVRVNPLDQTTAERLLAPRVIGLPVPFTALFYCLSGGMPRDLLRTARAAVSYIAPDRPRPLAEIAGKLVVERELARIANAAGGPEDPAGLLQLFRAEVVAEHGGLSEVGNLIHERAAATAEGARMAATLANRAYHLDTVLRIFTADLTRDQIVLASDPTVPGSFAVLARAQRETGTADAMARATLQRVRQAWSLPVLPSLPSLPPVA
ncbi:P-loop NTPase fold protein [Kitasatospora sp. NPDC058965]|uniref:P-loop NTPase fold protein n=1 Tax=Kitasatospora sp. NPDC058965 TaxID=3346682 RepID=UPI0036C046E5